MNTSEGATVTDPRLTNAGSEARLSQANDVSGHFIYAGVVAGVAIGGLYLAMNGGQKSDHAMKNASDALQNRANQQAAGQNSGQNGTTTSK